MSSNKKFQFFTNHYAKNDNNIKKNVLYMYYIT
jgi:hypothetical protein